MMEGESFLLWEAFSGLLAKGKIDSSKTTSIEM